MREKSNLKYRKSLDFIGYGGASVAYGGFLNAWSFTDTDAQQWFSTFRTRCIESIGKHYCPVYRLADGEYRFLMGRKLSMSSRPSVREILGYFAEKLGIVDPDDWTTSWGEAYSPQEVEKLRSILVSNIRDIAEKGFLACYINDNGLHAFTEYNLHVENYFFRNNIQFCEYNYIPFHFPCALLMNGEWRDLYVGRKILIVSGTDELMEAKISSSIRELGARTVEFLRISKTSSMKDTLDLSAIEPDIDVCFVAAGIGSASVIRQLEPLQTLVLDIGGYIECFIDSDRRLHGGIFGVPQGST